MFSMKQMNVLWKFTFKQEHFPCDSFRKAKFKCVKFSFAITVQELFFGECLFEFRANVSLTNKNFVTDPIRT